MRAISPNALWRVLPVLGLTILPATAPCADPAQAFPPVRAAGAVIDEAAARAVVRVTPTTLRAGFTRALANLSAGVATRVVMAPGTYRGNLSDLAWDAGRAQETLLVIEGKAGKTVWSGDEVYSLSTWRKMPGGLLVHAWPHTFGSAGTPWSPPGDIGYRREMAFVSGRALRPQVLETFRVGGRDVWGASKGLTYAYTGLRDPAKTLRPGEFGVTERPENGGHVFLRLPTGVRPAEDGVQLSVEAQALYFGAKRNLVLRGLNFVRFASPMVYADPARPGEPGPVGFAAGADGCRNILIDHCRFLWNSGTALHMSGKSWTVRDSIFNYNGLSGVASGDCSDVVLDGDETSFNCWRIWRAGENDWAYGGLKMHGTDLQLVTHHLALGNCSTGLWWDIYCGRVDLTDSVSLANANCAVKYEFSSGPFHGSRLVLAGSKLGPEYAATVVTDTLLDHSVLYHNYNPTDHGGNGRGTVASLMNYPRSDPQAVRPIPGGVQGIKDCVLLAGLRTPTLVRAEWWDPEATPEDHSIRFKAAFSGNVYDAAGHVLTFQIHVNPGPLQPAARFRDFAAETGDTGSRVVNSSLNDPGGYDFRISRDSPLWPRRGEWPQYRLPAAHRQEMLSFFAWLGCGPEGPATPPADEPQGSGPSE